VSGKQQKFVPFAKPGDTTRASLSVDSQGLLAIGPRSDFPASVTGDLLQAGPLLLSAGKVVVGGAETQGFSVASNQFDSDITKGRYPRAAIGYDESYLWSVVCDGSSDDGRGLSLEELAQVMLALGATDAMNLDGGGSATQVSGGKLRNHPWSDGALLPEGRPIFTAIVFDPKN